MGQCLRNWSFLTGISRSCASCDNSWIFYLLTCVLLTHELSVKKKLEYIQLYVPFRSEASISSCNLEIKGESNCKQYTKSAGFLNSDFFSSPQESIITGECFNFYFSIFIEHLLCAWHCSRNWVCRNKLKKGTVLMGSYSNDTFKQLWSTWTREKKNVYLIHLLYTWKQHNIVSKLYSNKMF